MKWERGLRMQKRGSPTWGKTDGSPGRCWWEISRQCLFSGFRGSHTFNPMKQPESISKKVKKTGNKSRHQMQNSGIQLKRREIPWMTKMGSPGQELCSCSEEQIALKTREYSFWMASPTLWTWVWVSSISWWWTGKACMLQSVGLQRVRHD